ncbi:MAG: adenylosuccinate lyase [Myxococcales bacterium]|nr:adenylosuccinate lyase [Polyangiaceae bacterium]MDW8248179.1 adenylosuccinate lyase [Myxococcales bacterium]
MIPRYSPREFVEIWSPESRYATWLEVELCACEAMEVSGLVPAGTAASLRAMNLTPRLDTARIEEIESTVKHDVIAFLTHVEELAGPPARWLHRGMTSSDVLDTSLALLLVRATDGLIQRQQAYYNTLMVRAREYAGTAMIGRSHGIHAEPITFGLALAGHAAEARRGVERLRQARAEVAVGKISGVVGTYAHLSPQIEAEALRRLGLTSETISTQVVARDRHASYFAILAVVGAGIERLATNVRHWQRTEVGEAEEPFTAGQKGSSAMPHKRNPILSENLTGLARLLRGYMVPALEDVALWHERDISHSSVERVIAPDATTTLAFMQERARGIVEGMVVYPERLKANLDRTGGLFFSEALLLALVEKGVARQQGYVLVQRNAMKAIRGEGSFLENLLADIEVRELLSEEEIRRTFDQEHALRYARELVERALG